MPHMNEREYLEELVLDAEDTVDFFSSKRKPERERSACAAFLRCLGIDFSTMEIVSSPDEPPDVTFREARFEVLEIPDEDRRRHDEWKAESERRRQANSLDDLGGSYRPPIPIPYEDVVALANEKLARKAMHYSKDVRACLDALVYANLIGKFLDLDSPFPSLAELRSQGWRSVSVIMPPYGRRGLVFIAEPSAPPFLRNLVGQTMSEWKSPDGLFEL